MALAAKRGEIPMSKLKGAAKSMAADMSATQLAHYSGKVKKKKHDRKTMAG